jgi:hypothetical protein
MLRIRTILRLTPSVGGYSRVVASGGGAHSGRVDAELTIPINLTGYAVPLERKLDTEHCLHQPGM